MSVWTRAALGSFALSILGGVAGCAAPPIVAASPYLPVQRVVVYRNGVAFFERSGHVATDEVRFKMQKGEVSDFLATLAVMERGGSSVRAAAFPLKDDDVEQGPDDKPPVLTPDQKKGLQTVVLTLDGKEHDLQVGYVADSPVWKPSYRLVVHSQGDADLQAWGIVENLSGEDWKNVKLSLVAGAPLAFRADLGTPVIPDRPTVTDNGEVIAAVPHAETTLAGWSPPPEAPAAAAEATKSAPAPASGPMGGDGRPGDAIGDSFGAGGLGLSGTGEGGGGRGQGIGLGSGRGRLGGGHQVKAPALREGSTSVNGRLPAPVIQRIVRQNFGRFRLCYENGLRNNPNLQGRVAVKFVIDRAGSVAMNSDGGSDLPDQAVVSCIVRAFGNLSFPQPEGGLVTVVYPISFSPGDEDGNAPSSGPAAAATPPPAPPPPPAVSQPRNVLALAAIGVEGGATRYDLPLPVTIPDHSATMVMLLSRPVSGEALFLFAPDGGVPDSSRHPFRVARFTNATPGLLERGPIAVFEEGAFLGQGMLDPLPPGATATVPFALERSIALDIDHKFDEQGARLAKIENSELTIERDRVTQTKYRMQNGGDKPAKILVKHPRVAGSRLQAPPVGTEDNVGTGSALVPATLPPHGNLDLLVDERSAERLGADWFGALADNAIKAYVADPKSDQGVVQKLNAAWVVRADVVKKNDEHNSLQRQASDLSRASEETRRNLRAIEKNKTAEALRQKLTARLADNSAKLDDIQRRVVELDSKLAELGVQFNEAIRDVKVGVP
jgi:hypothetical protein